MKNLFACSMLLMLSATLSLATDWNGNWVTDHSNRPIATFHLQVTGTSVNGSVFVFQTRCDFKNGRVIDDTVLNFRGACQDGARIICVIIERPTFVEVSIEWHDASGEKSWRRVLSLFRAERQR